MTAQRRQRKTCTIIGEKLRYVERQTGREAGREAASYNYGFYGYMVETKTIGHSMFDTRNTISYSSTIEGRSRHFSFYKWTDALINRLIVADFVLHAPTIHI